jgi:hypothetical protein
LYTSIEALYKKGGGEAGGILYPSLRGFYMKPAICLYIGVEAGKGGLQIFKLKISR